MSDAPKAITFVRPDPSQFVLLIAKTRGNGIVTGTENFKPSGTEWATDQDMRDAGYVPLEDAKRAVHRLMIALPPTAPGASEAAREAMDLLGLSETGA
jgi:hypothetical protein